MSRGRKKPKKKRQVRRKPGATPQRLLADVLDMWTPVTEMADVLHAEVYGSKWLSMISERDDTVTGFDPDPAMILELLEFAGRQQTPTALALARTLSAVANSEDVRTAAADVASITPPGLPSPRGPTRSAGPRPANAGR